MTPQYVSARLRQMGYRTVSDRGREGIRCGRTIDRGVVCVTAQYDMPGIAARVADELLDDMRAQGWQVSRAHANIFYVTK